MVLVDYAASKSGETAYGLLSEFRATLACDGASLFRATLACDGASSFNKAVTRNGLSVALCNDHARRRFHKVCAGMGKEKAARSIAQQGLQWYLRLYAIERDIKDLPVELKYEQRQAWAVPLWAEFIVWARQVQSQGVAHAGTRDALSYLVKHANSCNIAAMTAVCRSPASNPST